jgi:HD-like signal output (HDOD) protein/signal transduction histidine kinase
MNLKKSVLKNICALKNLPTLPQVLLKIIKICNDDNRDFKELAVVLQTDPSLSIKILKMVNSPFYGLSKKVDDITQAVSILGINAVRNIAVCASVQGVFDRATEDRAFDLEAFWYHSLKSAILARFIAETQDQVDAEEAFLSGLLHDIGRLVLWNNFGNNYTRLLDKCNDTPEQCLETEAELAANHCQIAGWLLQNWNFQPFMADAVLYHHESNDRISTALPLVQVVYVANAFSRANIQTCRQFSEATENVFHFTGDEIEDFIVRAEEETRSIAQSLGIEIACPDETTTPATGTAAIADKELAEKVKDLSLLFGSLQNILEAEDQESLLKTMHQGFQILFSVEDVIFFLRNPEHEWLTGKTFSKNRKLASIKGLQVPMHIRESLLNRTLSLGKPLDSFERSEQKMLAVLDEQIIGVLGKEGILCLPMRSRGENVGVVVIGLDRTEFLNLEKQGELLSLYSAQAALAIHVDHLKESRFKRIQLERLKAYATLSRKVVHEVNTPLSIMKNYISVMKRKLSKDNSVQGELNFISEEIDRVARTIHVFSDFPKFEDLVMEPLKINGLISNLTKILIKSGLIGSKVKFQLNLDHDLPVIQTDKNKVKQILLNLVRNAVEAMFEGGNVFIRTRYLRNRLEIPGNRKTDTKLDYAEIMVKDDGPGIPEDIKSTLFDAYSTTKGSGHHGLGLSIVYNLVQELKGTITCESDGKEGTCFLILLPFM